jgi:hypothetical protein
LGEIAHSDVEQINGDGCFNIEEAAIARKARKRKYSRAREAT